MADLPGMLSGTPSFNTGGGILTSGGVTGARTKKRSGGILGNDWGIDFTDPAAQVALAFASNIITTKPPGSTFDGVAEAAQNAQIMGARRQEMQAAEEERQHIQQQDDALRAMVETEAPDLLPWIEAGQTEYAMTELDRRRNPKPDDNLVSVGGHLYNSQTGDWISPPGGGTEPVKVGAGEVLVDPSTGQPIYEGPEDMGDAFANEKDLYAQYTGSDIIKNYTAVKDGYERLRQSAALQTGAGDLGLIYGYMKMLDPASVVRETEFAMAAQAGSYGEQIQGLVQMALTGQRLPESVRRQFVQGADALYAENAANVSAFNEQFSSRANRYGVEPTSFIRVPETYDPAFGNGGGIPEIDSLVEKYTQGL